MEGYAAGSKNSHHVEVVKFIVDRKGEDGKVGKRPLRFQAYGEWWLGLVGFFPEGPFANDLTVAIKQLVNGVKPEVGHANVVGVGVDKGNGYFTSPIFSNGALFPGELLPGFSDLIPARIVTHFVLLII